MRPTIFLTFAFMAFLWVGCSSGRNILQPGESYVYIDYIDYSHNKVADYAFVISKQNIVNYVNKKRLSEADFSLVYKMEDANDSLYLKCPNDEISEQELKNWLSISDYIVTPFLKTHKITIYDKSNAKMECNYKIKKIKGLYGTLYIKGFLSDGRLFYETTTAFGE